MSMHQHTWDTDCPDCGIGSIRIQRRPFVRIHRGVVFTIPQAKYYHCDVCNYSTVDLNADHLMDKMIFQAMFPDRPDPAEGDYPSDDDSMTSQSGHSANLS